MMDLGFSEKIAVVSGAGSGIGQEVARQLAVHGATVVIVDLPSAAASQAEAFHRDGIAQVAACGVDVSEPLAVNIIADQIAAHFGRVDILVNCAGIFPRGTLTSTDDELWDRVMDVNVKGVFHCCQAVVPWLSKNPAGGAIVNVGSVNAYAGASNLLAYATSKGGVTTLTRTLAHSLTEQRIRVNGVNPGWVLTEGERAVQRAEGQPEDWPDRYGSRIPLGRILQPADIAAAVLFLASDQASQITGQILTVDGGWSVR